MTAPNNTDFDDWLSATFRDIGPFTMLFVLVAIGETSVEPLRAAYLHVVGEETRWADMTALFTRAGVPWSGVVFFRAGREGLVVDPEAKARLTALTRKLHEDRSVIDDGEFFNTGGLRLKLERLTQH